MGYTHYWYKANKLKNPAQWALLASDCRRLVRGLGIPLADGSGQEGSSPTIEQGKISFNGVGPQRHETFYLSREIMSDFNFCKTAQKPYDMAVMCCLVAAKERFPVLEVHSDGKMDDWAPAIARVKELLGYTPSFELKEGN